MNRDNYIESLRSELLDLVEEHLSPVALRYGYSEVPLEATIKWRPLVLVLGNYSSGKSTLINDFLGIKIQATGQALCFSHEIPGTISHSARRSPARCSSSHKYGKHPPDPREWNTR